MSAWTGCISGEMGFIFFMIERHEGKQRSADDFAAKCLHSPHKTLDGPIMEVMGPWARLSRGAVNGGKPCTFRGPESGGGGGWGVVVV